MMMMMMIPDEILYPSKRVKCSLLLSLKSNELLLISPDNDIDIDNDDNDDCNDDDDDDDTRTPDIFHLLIK